MSIYDKYEQELSNTLKLCIGKCFTRIRVLVDNIDQTANTVENNLMNLIDSISPYSNPTWLKVHKDALINNLAVNLPNDTVAIPTNYRPDWIVSYFGPYSGYRDAFYHGINASDSGKHLAMRIWSTNEKLNHQWWSKYSVAILTDAIKSSPNTQISLDSDKLFNDLHEYNNLLKPALTASCLAIFEVGYQETTNRLNVIKTAGQTSQACSLLDQSIAEGEFTANINQAISMGGDSIDAATWFLFNLWVSLKALGHPNVDEAITTYKNNGLLVPEQVGPINWWNGGYTSWYTPLHHTDIINMIKPILTESLPMLINIIYYPPHSYVYPPFEFSIPYGYNDSFCTLGSLAWYKTS